MAALALAVVALAAVALATLALGVVALTLAVVAVVAVVTGDVVAVVVAATVVAMRARLFGAVGDLVVSLTIDVLVDVGVVDGIEVMSRLFVRRRRGCGATLVCSVGSCIACVCKEYKVN